MAFIVIEGIDRSGKSTVAEYYKKQGFEYVHMSAPDKKYSQPGYVGPNYLDEMVGLLMRWDGQNVVFDRSWYGELVWSVVYNRPPQLDEDAIDILRELEERNDTHRILMIDSDLRAHWKRCVDNKEPLTAQQFQLAHQLYSKMAHKYGFAIMTLPDFLAAHPPKEESKDVVVKSSNSDRTPATDINSAPDAAALSSDSGAAVKISHEQQVLEKANAINSILRSKRIFKQQGGPYDALESQVRQYLNAQLGELLGVAKPSPVLSSEDISIVKEFVRRLKDKQGAK